MILSTFLFESLFAQETRTNLDNLRAMEVRPEIFLSKQNIQNIFRTPSTAG